MHRIVYKSSGSSSDGDFDGLKMEDVTIITPRNNITLARNLCFEVITHQNTIIMPSAAAAFTPPRAL